MATISTRQGILGSPFANIFSVSDGTKKKSTGVPYMYLTDLEMSVKDLKVDNRASITMSLAQTSFCKRHKYDPESPLCAHVVLTGNVEKVGRIKSCIFLTCRSHRHSLKSNKRSEIA